jgi:spore coat protein A, manganese oxidase
MLTRRNFLRGAAASCAGIAVPAIFGARRLHAFAQSTPNIRKFVTTLPGLTPAGANNWGQYIPLATKETASFAGLTTDIYRIGVGPFAQNMHPGLQGDTHFWGYYDLKTGDRKYLGGVIVAKRGTPVLLYVTNNLPNVELIPVDPTVMAGMGLTVGQLPLNRVAVHLHGGDTPWISDGTPFQWYDPLGRLGESFKQVPGADAKSGTGSYYYPMNQSARLLWYHDHAIGITRTNAYAGIASALVLTDDFEDYLVANKLVPDLVGIPLIIQDKSFVPANIASQDPRWKWGKPGDLWYPHEYEYNNGPYPSTEVDPEGRVDYGPTVEPPAVLPDAAHYKLPPVSIVPEFFGDTTMVNGAPFPVLNVTEGTFRFRILNASQARFWHLNLYGESSIPGEADLSKPGPTMYQIATEGGFLPNLVPHPNGIPIPLDLSDETRNTADPASPFNLLLAPAERADVLIDFAGRAGEKFILYSDSPAPFPGGDPRNDYYTGNPDYTDPGRNEDELGGGAPPTQAGQGPNTRTIMKIAVGSGTNGFVLNAAKRAALSMALQQNFRGGNPVVPQQPPLLYDGGDAATPGPVPYNGRVHRRLTLNEDFDDYGRLGQNLGTFTSESRNNQGLPSWSLSYTDVPTETPAAGSVEVWEVFNLTMDVHPIHFHLVNVQIIQRRPFSGMPGTEGEDWEYTDDPRPPDPNEFGWKETVRMNPGESTTVTMKFDLPQVPFTMPMSPREGIDGHEYVWHCHILEHEEHDMMRPMVVAGPTPMSVVPEKAINPASHPEFTVYNGTPPYHIISNNPNFQPLPDSLGNSGDAFTFPLAKGGLKLGAGTVTLTVVDSAGKQAAAWIVIS